LRVQADLLPQLAEHRFLRQLARTHAPLRKLPAAAAGATADEQAPVRVHQDDAHIGPEPVAINNVAHE